MRRPGAPQGAEALGGAVAPALIDKPGAPRAPLHRIKGSQKIHKRVVAQRRRFPKMETAEMLFVISGMFDAFFFANVVSVVVRSRFQIGISLEGIATRQVRDKGVDVTGLVPCFPPTAR